MLYKNLSDNNLQAILFKRKLFDGLAAIIYLLKGDFAKVRSVWKAHIDLYKNMNKLKLKRAIVKNLKIPNSSYHILNKSIVFEFYIKGNKTFNSLKFDLK